MLRNSYFDYYQNINNKKSQLEKEYSLYQNDDLKNILYLQRPMSTKRIKKIPFKLLPTFIDSIMCDNSINSLLYSSNAHKEIYFYLRQKKALMHSNVNPRNSPKKKKTLSALGTIMANKNNLQVIKSLKTKINSYLYKRNETFEKYRNKQEKFLKSNPMIENKLKKLYYKPINEIRLQGYKRAFNQCLNKSISDSTFILPNMQFNMYDVYSRLFNNVILSQNILKEKKKQSKGNERYETGNKTDKSKNMLQTYKKNIPKTPQKSNNKKLLVGEKYSTINNKTDYYYRRIPSFNISNIIKNSRGKEFSIKITPKIRKRCWSTLSGGPRIKLRPVKIIFDKNDENNKSEEIDYREIRNKNIFNINKSNSKSNINNIILYNTLLLDKNNRGSEFVKLKNYRDINFNSNLHIAVKNNSIKLVKYFLDKKISPNEVNKKGQTPLHFALKQGNKDIIDLLIKNGGDINIRDNKGKKPFDYGSKEVLRFFQLESQK